MADDPRQSGHDLTRSSNAVPEDGSNFFQTLRVLERSGHYFGRSGRDAGDPARLAQDVRLVFATSDVAGFSPANDDRPATVQVRSMGLMGPEGPLPLHMTRWTLDRMSQRWFAGDGSGVESDTAFNDFCTVLQHRLIALYYRSWADTRAEVQIERDSGGRVRAMLAALSGIGLPGTRGHDPLLDPIKLRQAPALANQVHGPEKLTEFLADVIRAPVRLKELVGNWVTIPEHLRGGLGKTGVSLGHDATLGARVFMRQNRIELAIGPVSLRDYKRLMPGGALMKRITKSILYVIGQEKEVDIRLVLDKAEIPEPKLGLAELGRTTWLGNPTGVHAEDLRLARVVGRRDMLSDEVAA